MKPDETIPPRVDFWEPIWRLGARMTNGLSLSDWNHRRLSVLDGLHPLAQVSALLGAEMGLVVKVQVTWSMRVGIVSSGCQGRKGMSGSWVGCLLGPPCAGVSYAGTGGAEFPGLVTRPSLGCPQRAHGAPSSSFPLSLTPL